MEKKKTFKELFAGTGIEPTTDENGGVHYNFNATLKKPTTPIELPSDEEIKENADKYTIDNNTYYSFINGAKWMKEKYLTKTNNMKKTTTNPTYPSYKTTDLVNYLNDSGTGTLSQTFMPTYLNEQIVINAHDFLPSTSIFATTIDGELIDVINIKDSFNRLPKDEKLKVVSVLLEFCTMETCKLTNQNK